ncbi:DNA-binding MarR family transcriptional regulator [Haloactinopolyspora alba]|uniref:DNA-binding MarR family transcriptional regulator n=1 Tax=Haloactinopolyspora alba TaxID=648780 RepID=A0A2P8DV99_9ACTN|nr:MarR family transcriptional regulator [Haloactinopolyspora alba]PSL01131.1 DNA-binding MarR family transcriptional regulator [Haloactinopolyspora alba]
MSGDVWGEVVEQVRMLMRSTRHLSQRHLEIYEGLGPTLGGMLGLLAREGPMRLTGLAEQLHVDTSVASRQVAELVDRGLVVRRPDPADARAGLLEVGDEGRAVVARFHDRRAEVLAAALSDWDAADAHQLVTLLTRLNGDFRRVLCTDELQERTA